MDKIGWRVFMGKIVFSTVGTSIFTNITRLDKDFEKLYGSFCKGEEKEEKIKNHVRKIIANQKDKDRISAEIKSLNKIGVEYDDILYFIVTDTKESRLAGDILSEYFEDTFNATSKVLSIPNLVVNDSVKFEREGIKNLIEKLLDIIQQNPYAEIIFNPTGGYKGVVPYLTILGMIYNKKIAYIFENTDNLIELPPMPLEFNYDLIKENEERFEKLEREGALKEEEFFEGIDFSLRGAFNSLLLHDGGYVTLSGIGLILYSKYRAVNDKKFIYLSKQAMKFLNRISDRTDREKILSLLQKLLKEDIRNNYIHTNFEDSITDCKVFKMPATAERIFFYLKGEIPWVCEIVPDHDEYMRELGNQGIFKKNYTCFEKLYFDD